MESEYVEFTVGIDSSENLTESLSKGQVHIYNCDRGNVYSFINTKLFSAYSKANPTSFRALQKEWLQREKILDEVYVRENMVSWIYPHKISSVDNSRTYHIEIAGAPFQVINDGPK